MKNQESPSAVSRMVYDLIKDIDWSGINEARMESLLVGLYRSDFFPAVVRYLAKRTEVLNSYMYIPDPFKEPTTLARYQGQRLGLWDLVEAIATAVEKSKKKVEGEGKTET